MTPSEPVIPGQVGELFYVDTNALGSVSFELRTHDEARNASSAGTEIPVVTENALRHRLQFLSVPVSPSFRVLLRVYSCARVLPDPAATRFPRLRVLDEETGALLADDELYVYRFVSAGPGSYDVTPYPNSIALNLAVDPRLSGERAVRIAISSADKDWLWGLLTLTNNETHEVTVVSPWPPN